MMLKYYKWFMWPPFPCALCNRAVPEEGQQLGLVPTAPNKMLYLLFTGWVYTSLNLGLGLRCHSFISLKTVFFKDVYAELGGLLYRVD